MDRQDLQSRVAECFAHNKLVFAGHPADEDCALRLLLHCRESGVGWQALGRAFAEYLHGAGAWRFDIDTQMLRVETAMRFWLKD